MGGNKRATVVLAFTFSLVLLFSTALSYGEQNVYTVRDVLKAMQVITKGRVIGPDQNPFATSNRFIVTKSSGIPGKAVTEVPGLVYGRLDNRVKKIGVVMTINEGVIELAGGMGINVLVAHHPFADATNFGGVRIKDYCALYGLNLFEAHEAFHGRHPGIAFLHGYKVKSVSINYGGDPGNILFLGQTFPDVKTLGDIMERLEKMMSAEKRDEFLRMQRDFWKRPEIQEAYDLNKPAIILGTPDSKVKNIVHIFPHTGFKPEHLEKVYRDNPQVDTVLASISHVKPDNALVIKAKELGLKFILGNIHPDEIYENGLPLGKALERLLPGVPVFFIEQRITAVPMNRAGNASLQEYGEKMADILAPK